jgi:hypothetical protein
MKRTATGEAVSAVAGTASAFAPAVSHAEQARAEGFYTVTFVDANGVEQWSERVDNLVTTVGKNFILDTVLAGSAYTATWFIGLMSSVSYTTGAAAGDTMASHGGWTESVAYSNATRVAPSFGAASAGSKATTATAFNINASDTIKGVFLNSVSTKSGTTGTLYSAGLFTGGDQVVTSGGTLNVTYTASV